MTSRQEILDCIEESQAAAVRLQFLYDIAKSLVLQRLLKKESGLYGVKYLNRLWKT